MQIDDLDTLLENADPAGDLTPDERQQVAAMAARSVPGRRRRPARPVATAAIAVSLLGVGAVAAAAAGSQWSPWAQDDPLVSVSYVRPSGTTCELRFGNLTAVSEEYGEVVRDTVAGARITDADIAAALEHFRARTDVFAEDKAYDIGVGLVLRLRILEALEANGILGQSASYESEIVCS